MEHIKALVQAQFGANAHGYVTSTTHATGSDLQRMIDLAQPHPDEQVLDIATGGGHTALAFAPHVAEVVASDFTPQMLAAAQQHAAERGAPNIVFQYADAEALPFADASFAIVTTRIAPHHFPNPAQFVREVARVLRPGGRFVLNDNMAPAEPELDAFMNRFEQWRDPGHVRAYTVEEWVMWMIEAGLAVTHVEPLHAKRYQFADWASRMAMQPEEQAALEQWLLHAPPACATFFDLKQEHNRLQSLCGMFSIIVAQRPAADR